jgi:hypothetical protein
MRALWIVLPLFACSNARELSLRPEARLDVQGRAREVAVALGAEVPDRATCPGNYLPYVSSHFRDELTWALNDALLSSDFRLVTKPTPETQTLTIDSMRIDCSTVHETTFWGLDYVAHLSTGEQAHGHLQRASPIRAPSDHLSLIVAQAIEDISHQLLN